MRTDESLPTRRNRLRGRLRLRRSRRAVVRPKLDLLRDALGPDERTAVQFVDMAALGHNPARILPAWLAFAVQHAGAPAIRGVGEPIRADRRAAEIAESQLHEALLNVAVDPSKPLHLCCPYDALTLDDTIISQALHTHSDDGGIGLVLGRRPGPGPRGGVAARRHARRHPSCRPRAGPFVRPRHDRPHLDLVVGPPLACEP